MLSTCIAKIDEVKYFCVHVETSLYVCGSHHLSHSVSGLVLCAIEHLLTQLSLDTQMVWSLIYIVLKINMCAQ